MMKSFEVKGFWSLVVLVVLALIALAVAITFPVSFVWVLWNALVGEMFHSPMISFWQAGILTLALAVAFKIVFQPEIGFEVKAFRSKEEAEKALSKELPPKE